MEELVLYGAVPRPDDSTTTANNTSSSLPPPTHPLTVLAVHDLRRGTPVHAFKKAALPVPPAAGSSAPVDASFTRVCAPVANAAHLSVYSWAREAPDQQLVVPEKLASVRVSPSGIWLAAGAASGRFYLWESASGSLVAVRDAHYQALTHIEWAADESFVVTAAADNRVRAWRLTDLVRESSSTNTSTDAAAKPAAEWTGHNFPITGLCLGYGPASAPGLRVYSSCAGNTVRIHDLELALASPKTAANSDFTLVFPAKVTSLAVDPADRAVYAGLASGSIYSVSLYTPSASILFKNASNVLTIDDSTASFAAPVWASPVQGTAVTALALSFDATVLAAGTADGVVTIIDLPTQTVSRTLPRHSGPITALRIVSRPMPQAHTQLHRGKVSAVALTPEQTTDYHRLPQLKRSLDVETSHDVWINIPDNFNENEEDDAFKAVDSMLESMGRGASEFGSETSESVLRTRLQKVEEESQQLRAMYSELSSMHAALWKIHQSK
ncbi:uncharacterized protein SAPINGB_P006369 [Magnusiomyces paraingens]|uniref:Pre-rRNA-processing protein IPI3 n=1 Tax=Magnusiomyces paraingens TaxID=2606893 RepID=A0A5E8C9R0_9ASCO|nr:uncharacterized protein SAPINGB_P006369 [Saprochaete ingens]VVT58758.1 unnamed protein product [Saprochaete ingens]